MWVRWYSRQSCKWSKWRYMNQDWLDSDPYAAVRMSRGQETQVVAFLPHGATVKV